MGLVVKGEDLNALGPVMGPFGPDSVSYTLYNNSDETMAYTATVSDGQPWLTVTPESGNIAPGAQITVIVSIDSDQANLLQSADYTATLGFEYTGAVSGMVNREAKLRVGAPLPIYSATFDNDSDGFYGDGEFGNPWHQTNTCVSILPGHSADGILYYGRDDRCNYNVENPLRYKISSPRIDIPRPQLVELSFNYLLWTGSETVMPDAEIQISVNDGPFQLVAANVTGEANPENLYELHQTMSWEHTRFDISHLFQALPNTDPPNIEIEITFDPFTAQSNNTPGFAIDGVTVYAYPYNLGDVNHSGRVDIVDALQVAQHYVNLNPPGVDLSVADVNLDGAINIVDALLIAQYYVGIITALPLPPDAIAPTVTQPVTNMDEAQAVIEDAMSLP